MFRKLSLVAVAVPSRRWLAPTSVSAWGWNGGRRFPPGAGTAVGIAAGARKPTSAAPSLAGVHLSSMAMAAVTCGAWSPLGPALAPGQPLRPARSDHWDV